VRMKVVNLEQGMPTVEQARARLTDEMRAARREGIRLLKLIHGYGSSGTGGALRDGILGSLGRMKMQREIQDFVAGEDWRIANEITWALIKVHPELRNDPDLSRGNRGISVVVL